MVAAVSAVAVDGNAARVVCKDCVEVAAGFVTVDVTEDKAQEESEELALSMNPASSGGEVQVGPRKVEMDDEKDGNHVSPQQFMALPARDLARRK